MKKTGLFKIIMFTLLGTVVASWIFSASYYSEGNLADLGMNNVGIFDSFAYFIKSMGFAYFIQIVLLFLSIGALYGVLERTGKYRAWIEKIVRNLKGKEFLFIVATSFIITIITSVFDYGFSLLIFFPLIMSILLAMGYDKVTVALATVGAMLIGGIGSTVGYNTTGVISELLNLGIADGFYFKLALLLLSYVALLLYLSKAKRRRVTEQELEEEDLYIGDKTANKYSITPIIIVLVALFVLLVLGCTSWAETFNLKVFSKLHDTVTTFSPKLPYFHITPSGVTNGYEKVAVFGKILGDIPAFGSWYYAEMAVMCFFASLLLSLIYRIKPFESMAKGIRKMLTPAFMVFLTYVVIYFTGNQMFYPTIAKLVLGLSNKFSVIISSILMAFASFLHVDILYVANYAVPQIAATSSNATVVSLLSQSIYGLTMFVAPTSSLLVFVLTYLGIPYKEWLKKTWKLVVSLLVIILAILLIAKFV